MVDNKIDWGMMYGRNYPRDPSDSDTDTDTDTVPRNTKSRNKPKRSNRETDDQRDERLNKLFIADATRLGRWDWLDDDQGVAFRAWKRDNGYAPSYNPLVNRLVKKLRKERERLWNS